MMLPFQPSSHVAPARESKTDLDTPFVPPHMILSTLSRRIASAATVAAVALAAIGCASPAEPTSTPMLPTPTNTPEPTATPVPIATPTRATAAELLPPIGPVRTYELRNTQEWLNGDPTTIAALRNGGEVVLIDFWTYT